MLLHVLSLKANHPTLYQQVNMWFKSAAANDFEGIEYSHDQRVEGGHHRTENRHLWAVPVSQIGGLYEQHQWVGVQTVVMIVRGRYLWNKITQEVQFYLTSVRK